MLVKINERFIYDTEEERVYHILPRPWIYDPLAQQNKVNIMDDDDKPICLTKKEIEQYENTRRTN